MKKIVVIGIGYVGLPAALMLAKSGYSVVGYDVDEELINRINNKDFFFDNELESLLFDETIKRNFTASNKLEEADVFLIAVPTPLHPNRKSADLSHVIKAIESILSVLRKGNLIIIESTIPPLTCREIILPIIKETGFVVGDDIFLAHCPERLLPGDICREIIENDRIIGGFNPESAYLAKEIYASFVKGKLIITDDKTAEICKLMENTYRDVNIALANEFSEICEIIDVNVFDAIKYANYHPRVNILTPGIGVGGHCIPIDPWFIIEVDPFSSTLIQAARRINDQRPEKIAAKIRKLVKDINSPKILICGKAFKAETHDIRESPAMKIYNALLNDGYNTEIFDCLTDQYNTEDLYERILKADCVALLVEHQNMVGLIKDILCKLKSSNKRIPLLFNYSETKLYPS